MHWFKVASDVATTQDGLFSWTQVRELGMSRAALDRYARQGAIIRVQPEVYRLAGIPPSWLRDLRACVLSAPGSAVAGRAALRLWGANAPAILEITIERQDHQPRLLGEVRVHRASDLRPVDITQVNGLAVTTPARSLVDAGLVWREGILRQAVQQLMQNRKVTPTALHRILHDLSRKGRTGVGRLRVVCAELIPDVDRTELERVTRNVLAGTTGKFVEQHRLTTPDGRIIKPDFFDEETLTSLEAQSFQWHSTPSALRADAERRNLTAAMGIAVLEYTWWDVTREPSRVRAEVDAVLAARRAARSGF